MQYHDCHQNPEAQFQGHGPDYTGMTVTELTFAMLTDYKGIEEPYLLDLIVREDTAGKREAQPLRPAVIFVHGGGFLKPSDRKQAYIPIFARILTAAGYAVISPDYPQFDSQEALEAAGGEAAGYAKSAEAIRLTVAYLKAHRELGVDPEQIFLIGGSAGGWACYHALAAYHDGIRAYISLWGEPQRLPDVSAFPPTLMIHGTEDALVPYALAVQANQAFADAGVPHRLITLEGAGHTPLARLGEYMPAMMAWLTGESR